MSPKVLLLGFSHRIFFLLNTQGSHALRMLTVCFGQSIACCTRVLNVLNSASAYIPPRYSVPHNSILRDFSSSLLPIGLSMIGSMNRCPVYPVPFTYYTAAHGKVDQSFCTGSAYSHSCYRLTFAECTFHRQCMIVDKASRVIVSKCSLFKHGCFAPH